MNMGTLLLWVITALCLIGVAQGQSIPVLVSADGLDGTLIETVPVDTIIGKVVAEDPDGGVVTYAIVSGDGDYFGIDGDTGEVFIRKNLDFETDYELYFTVMATDTNGGTAFFNFLIFVDDVNDNAPFFDDYGIYKEYFEDEEVGILVTNIYVEDLDTANSVLDVFCNGSTLLFADACETFELVLINKSNSHWNGYIRLAKALDFEKRTSYSVQLTVFDGKTPVHNEIHLEVKDVNDAPPIFTQYAPSIIYEEEPVVTVFQTLQAVDQDTQPRQIFYEVIGEYADEFTINNVTGQLGNAIRLDYDNVNFPKETPYDLTIKAAEILEDGSIGNDSTTTATVVIKVTVLDINDNTPTFDSSSYEVSVEESIVSGANVPGLQMTITDIDSGTYNSFELVTLDYTDVFGVIPSEDAASSSATLFVIDGTLIDFESGKTEYVVVVEARQNKVTNPTLTGTATVTITVTDVNDVTPSFEEESYTRTISENVQGSSDVTVIDIDATDIEAGDFGEAGIVYELYGDNLDHFEIEPLTGVVTVADCTSPNTPGVDPCIDYESKTKYTLSVSATDENGFGRSRSVQLIINVEDVNDESPSIEQSYTRYIYENEMVTIDPLRIDAADPDTVGGPLSFSLQGTTLWKVETMTDSSTGALYGNITAVRPIQYEDAVNGLFEFFVEVSDINFRTSAPVYIYVVDINNHVPVFVSPQDTSYLTSIYEDTAGLVSVITVTASDGDSPTLGNGILDISISGGDRSKFFADATRQVDVTGGSPIFVADILTTAAATFDFDTEPEFVMTLLVRDQGTPESLQSTGTLTVKILDINNRDPFIQPSYDSVAVPENTPISTVVHSVTATDADDDKDLRFSFQATSATDANGASVDASLYNYHALFGMDETTGNVYVNSSLDRDRAASVTFDLLVRDVGADPVQSGTGILLIYITEYNDQAPQFNTTQYEIQIEEELNINSFIQTLYCTDVDDKIASYDLVQDEPRRPTFFSFYASSGAIFVEDRIDYDSPNNIEKIELTAYCTDTGEPQLTSSVKVIVEVININDNLPVFNQDLYTVTIPEGTGGGILNVDIQATDIDSGDYGVVRYRLVDTNSRFDAYFTIDNVTGVITITDDAVFDREDTAFIDIEVEAYDSPNDPSVRRSNTAPVYITIEDINDNCPVFTEPSGYSAIVPESSATDVSILDTFATDADEGNNAAIVYTYKMSSGNPANTSYYFYVDGSNGRVYVENLLRDQVGFFTFIMVATDMSGDNSSGLACASEVLITVEVIESLNSAPRWLQPPRRDFVIYVLESQYEGMLVYSAKASDENTGESGVVDYYFMYSEELSHTTPEFRINRVTGVIRAEVIFDREEQDTYFLTLLAKDRGTPAASSETTLTITILDVDDNDPVFPMKNGLVEPLYLPQGDVEIIDDGTVPNNGYIIGKCSATDADSDHENNRIFYDILAAETDVRNLIEVNATTCDIRLMSSVDYDVFPTLEFDILAYNEKNDDTVIRYRTRREVNPSIQHVIVEVEDKNDNPPEFTNSEYFGCISYDAPFNKTILEVQATDVDEGDNSRIRYSLIAASLNKGFAIDAVVGNLFNTKSFRDVDERLYELGITASDNELSSNVNAVVAVTSPSNTVRLKVDQPLSDVQPFSQQLISSLTEGSEVVYACIDEMRNHINDDGEESETATDVFVTALRADADGVGGYSIIPAGELVNIINAERDEEDSAFEAIDISEVEVEGDDDGTTIEEDVVIAALILAILLIALALLLVCIACYCLNKKEKKKKRKIQAHRHSIKEVQEPVTTSFNPVYDYRPDESEYSSVKKVQPTATPIAPVVIPAPENLEPLMSEDQGPTNLVPVEPVDDDIPVIETEVMPEEPPLPAPVKQFQPEFEDRIDYDDDLENDAPQLPLPPQELDDDTIEVIIDDSVDSLPKH